MKEKKVLAISLLAAAWLAFNIGPSWAQGTAGPAGATPESKVGAGEKSESGQVGQPQTGTKGKSQTGQTGTAGPAGANPEVQTKPESGQVGQPQTGTKGRSQTGETGTAGPAGATPESRVGAGQTKSESAGRGSGQWAMQDVKQAQEALKSKGHDPGPIDGKMGPQTRQAIKAFQSSNNLKETGTLDSETAKKLGVEKGGAASGAPSSERGTSGAGKESTGAGKGSSSQRESSPPTTK